MCTKNTKPLIGVTGPDNGGEAMWIFIWLSLLIAGAKAVRITPLKPLTKEIQGLIVGGGSDVDSNLYGQERIEIKKEAKSFFSIKGLVSKVIALLIAIIRWILRTKEAPVIDVARDKLEHDLLSLAIDRGLPVLGICRGEQIMNVHAGGTLHQDLHGLYTETKPLRSLFPQKHIKIMKDSLLYSIMQREYIKVNALHRQGVDSLGENLVISATDHNGIIQAIEGNFQDFFLGVQWHPEFLPYVKSQRQIFKALVTHCIQKVQT